MNWHHLSSLYCITIFSFIIIPGSHCRDNYRLCHRHYICGDIQGVRYPFWGGNLKKWCGRNRGFKLSCIHHTYAVIDMSKRRQRFRMLKLDQFNYKMRIARWDLWHDVCLQNYTISNTTLDYELFSYGETVRKISLFYGCEHQPGFANHSFHCPDYGSMNNYFVDEESRAQMLKICSANIVVPISVDAEEQLFNGQNTLKTALREGFDALYLYPDRAACDNCSDSGGICGSDDTNEFICHYVDEEINGSDNNTRHGKPARILIGIASAAFGIFLFCIIAFYIKRLHSNIVSLNKKLPICIKTRNDGSFEMQITNCGSFSPRRYRYADIRKMTGSFKDKLGEGGCGIVYKGSLLDGRPVAVKILNKSNNECDQFINEVSSISRTSHVNIVSLLGFCLEDHRRALVYEFMANGSLEKFIYDGNDSTASKQLGWENLFRIAVGIARGLEYLHCRCSTVILHFDIKPHNILLDEKFCPKISDFGLAKLCCKEGSFISIKHARGTAGYIAPEVLSSSFGEVSHKSDVYSYGMMVLEMVGGKQNKNVEAEKAGEIYFPHWVYKRLQIGNDLGLCCVMSEEENEIARKLVLVGLWCIQVNPLHRPSMDEVIDMLEGCVGALENPPKQFMFSSPDSGSVHPSDSDSHSPATSIP